MYSDWLFVPISCLGFPMHARHTLRENTKCVWVTERERNFNALYKSHRPRRFWTPILTEVFFFFVIIHLSRKRLRTQEVTQETSVTQWYSEFLLDAWHAKLLTHGPKGIELRLNLFNILYFRGLTIWRVSLYIFVVVVEKITSGYQIAHRNNLEVLYEVRSKNYVLFNHKLQGGGVIWHTSCCKNLHNMVQIMSTRQWFKTTSWVWLRNWVRIQGPVPPGGLEEGQSRLNVIEWCLQYLPPQDNFTVSVISSTC